MGVKAFCFEPFCSEMPLAEVLGENTSFSLTDTHWLACKICVCLWEEEVLQFTQIITHSGLNGSAHAF